MKQKRRKKARFYKGMTAVFLSAALAFSCCGNVICRETVTAEASGSVTQLDTYKSDSSITELDAYKSDSSVTVLEQTKIDDAVILPDGMESDNPVAVLDETAAGSFVTVLGETESDSSVTVPGETESDSSVTVPGETESDSSVTVPDETESDSSVTVPGETESDSSVTVPGETESDSSVTVPGETESDSSVTVPDETESDSSVTVPGETESDSSVILPGETESDSSVTVPDQTELATEVSSEPDQTELETEEDSETEMTELESETEIDYPILLASAYTPPGTLASKSGTGYTVVEPGDRRYSGKYSEVQRTKASVVTPWNNSNGHVKKGTRLNPAGVAYTYYIPKDDQAAGKFGFKVTNVAYNREKGCSVDLNITVVAYNNFTYSKAGNKIEDIYPCIGYTPKGGLGYQPALPSIRLKCDLVESGTDTPVTGNYRFTLTDIDAGQIYGLTLFDGKIDAKYCTASTVIHTAMRTLSDGKSYHMMYAPSTASAETDKNYAVSFEVSGMSSFGIFIESRMRDGKTGPYTGSEIREIYNEIKTGTWETSGALLGWDSWAFGPPIVSPLNKYVSNDGVSWAKENTLAEVTSEFWYMLEVYVPEMSGYSYQNFYIQDTLPTGVEYVGDFSAARMETGADVTKVFTVTNGSSLVMKHNGNSGFNGYTYQLRFKVKLNPEKLTPVLNGTQAVYTVKNQGVLYYQTSADASLLTTKSNTVITTAKKQRPEPENPVKKINVNGTMVDRMAYRERGQEIQFTVRQKIPAYDSFWQMDSFTFADALEPCFELVRFGIGTDQKPQSVVFEPSQSGTTKSGWQFTWKDNKILAKLDSKGITSEHFSGTCVYRMDIVVKIKKGYDLVDYYKIAEDGTKEAQITNVAETVLGWGSSSVQRETNSVVVLLRENQTSFVKLDQATKKALAGAKLQLSKEDGTVIDTWTSSKEAHEILGLKAGTYIWTELEAPNGYKKAEPMQIVVKETEKLQKFEICDVKYVTITLKKAIMKNEIVWEHGNPTFTFCLEGTSLDGEEYIYYDTVEFTPENTGTGAALASADEAVLTVSFVVPAGTYTAYEMNVIRYHLEKIDGIVQGNASGPAVRFDLRKNEDAAAVFHNRKTTDQGITDTDFVRNEVV